MTMAAVYRVMNMYLRKDWLWELTPIGSVNKKDLEYVHDYTDKIIADRKAAFLEKKSRKNVENDDIGIKKKQAFLDTLLEMDGSQGVAFTNLDIREEVDTFLFEGHDTTASSVEFSIFELAHNPDVQEMAYKEQCDIFRDDDREATLSDLQKMNYLDRVIKESLRMYPSVPYISRAIHEDIQLKDFPTIPAGSNIVITPYYLHRNSKYFPDPEKFDPDRFLPENCLKRHPFSYIPFSAGPRNCIGQKFAMMELKVILSTLLRFAKVEPASKYSDMKLAAAVILRNLGTLNVRVVPRTKIEAM